MNKKLLTLAIGAALGAAPMIAAQAATTVYGVAHLSVDSLDNGNTAVSPAGSSILTLSSNSSYIGFKADEDLGGGMKAIFGAEIQLGLDNTGTTSVCTGGSATYNPTLTATASSAVTCTTTNANNMFNRNVFVGLQGGFGTVRLGNYDDIVKQIGRKVDLFYSEQIGENRNLTRQGMMDERMANSFNYETPSFGGFKVVLNYGMENTTNDAGTTSTAPVTQYAVGAAYESGPLFVGLAYKTVDYSNVSTAGTESPNGIRASVSYTLGDLQLVGLYQTNSNLAGTNGADNDVYGLGLGYTIGGKHRIKGQYYSASASNVADDNGASAYAVGYDFMMSKTTVLYVTYAAVTNDTAGTYSIIGAGHANPQDATYTATAAGNDPSGFSFGMRMAF
jgi:predicted porin